MIRMFCDQCGKETTDQRGRLTGTYGKISVEVIVAVDGVWNEGHACEDCIRRAVEAGTIKRVVEKQKVEKR